MDFEDAVRRLERRTDAEGRAAENDRQAHSRVRQESARLLREAAKFLASEHVPMVTTFGKHGSFQAYVPQSLATFNYGLGRQDVHGWALPVYPRNREPLPSDLLTPDGDLLFMHFVQRSERIARRGLRKRSARQDPVHCACRPVAIVACPRCPDRHAQLPEFDSDTRAPLHGQPFHEWLEEAVALAVVLARKA
ncbi:hypothetical protein [Nocardioides sp. KR10-350]|uniref:hypothetical protein n=1 Tax=Nocardioides cheoyonin TaxID=3156615 RepID=UPI0032B52A0C